MNDKELQKVVIYSVALVVGVFIASASYYLVTKMARYELSANNQFGFCYLLAKQTGAVWRYYRNTDDTGKLTTEGFTQVRRAGE